MPLDMGWQVLWVTVKTKDLNAEPGPLGSGRSLTAQIVFLHCAFCIADGKQGALALHHMKCRLPMENVMCIAPSEERTHQILRVHQI